MFLSLIRKRRSIRKYADRPIEAEKIDALIEAALRAPSSHGHNPWEFVFVTDRGVLERLARSKPTGATFIAGAPLGVVVCADGARSDVWVEDCAIASTFIQLAAESIGLGSCWIQIRRRMHDDTTSAAGSVARAVGVPADKEVLALIAIGYAARPKSSHGADTLQREKIHLNRYGTPYNG